MADLPRVLGGAKRPGEPPADAAPSEATAASTIAAVAAATRHESRRLAALRAESKPADGETGEQPELAVRPSSLGVAAGADRGLLRAEARATAATHGAPSATPPAGGAEPRPRSTPSAGAHRGLGTQRSRPTSCRMARVSDGRRAGILVTGTEVLSGYVTDRNGPWISERLAELGVEVAQITVVGDRPEDLEGALRHMRDAGPRPDRHQRRPRADRRRPDRRGRRALRRARAGARRGDGGEDRRDHRPLRAAAALRPRGRARGQPQAGDGARGRDGDRPGRDRAGPGRAGRRPGGDRAAGPAARAAGDVAARAGGRRRRRRCSAAPSPTRRCRSGCSGSRSPSSPRRCARSRTTASTSTSSRSPPACAAASWSPTFATATGSEEAARGRCAPASPSASGSSPTPRAASRSRRSSSGCSATARSRSPSRAAAGCWRRA